MSAYINRIRAKIGKDRLICPAARIIIENDRGEYLFIERTDNGQLGLPAGAMEEGETIEECIIRETREETGLTIADLQVIGISTNPQLETVRYPNGDETQYFTIEFYTNQFDGALKPDNRETKSVGFKTQAHIELLPPNERSTFESLAFYRKNVKIHVR